MKKLYTLFISAGLLFTAQAVQAQCIADAGGDQVVCLPDSASNYTLGGVPTVVGASNPEYTWSASVTDIFGKTFHASDFLDDTTIANPTFVDFPVTADSIQFKVEIEDNQIVPISCADSMYLIFSHFFVAPADLQASINPGDTISLTPAVGGGFGELTYSWSPNYNIINPDSADPRVYPDTTTFYVCTVTDAGGCTIESDTFEVYVYPLGLSEANMEEIFAYPNPFAGSTKLELNNVEASLIDVAVYSVNGQLVEQLQTRSNAVLVGEPLKQGTYIVVVSKDAAIISRGVIQKL